MKYCLNSRQDSAYLQKADEIKVEYRDKDSIPTIIERYPGKRIILMCYFNEVLDWKEIKKWNILSRNNFMLCLSSVAYAKDCKENNIPFYMGYPVKTYYELRALKDLGVSYVRLGEPLFFEMDVIKTFGIPVRAIPNVAYIDGLPREDGVCGTWIRPEDLDLYEDYVEVIEFEDADMKKEQAMFRIYAEQKNWPGDLSMIITNLNHIGLNRIIVPNIAEKRLICGQRCQKSSNCKLCYRALTLAVPEKIKDYMEATDQS